MGTLLETIAKLDAIALYPESNLDMKISQILARIDANQLFVPAFQRELCVEKGRCPKDHKLTPV